jgi:hypothetical protein
MQVSGDIALMLPCILLLPGLHMKKSEKKSGHPSLFGVRGMGVLLVFLVFLLVFSSTTVLDYTQRGDRHQAVRVNSKQVIGL